MRILTSDSPSTPAGPRRTAGVGRSGGGESVLSRAVRIVEALTPEELDLPAFLGAPQPGTRVYSCGPAPLLAAMEAACAGWPPHTLHTERFVADEPGAPSRSTPFEVGLARSGRTVSVAPGGSVLDAVAGAGVEVLSMFLAAANRDPRRWTEPDRFDLSRDPSGHVGFGFGLHQCVGQHVARLQAQALLTALAARAETLELAGPTRRHHDNTLRAWDSIPLRVRRT